MAFNQAPQWGAVTQQICRWAIAVLCIVPIIYSVCAWLRLFSFDPVIFGYIMPALIAIVFLLLGFSVANQYIKIASWILVGANLLSITNNLVFNYFYSSYHILYPVHVIVNILAFVAVIILCFDKSIYNRVPKIAPAYLFFACVEAVVFFLGFHAIVKNQFRWYYELPQFFIFLSEIAYSVLQALLWWFILKIHQTTWSGNVAVRVPAIVGPMAAIVISCLILFIF